MQLEIRRARIRSHIEMLFRPSSDLQPVAESPSFNLWNSDISQNVMLYISLWEREEFIFSWWQAMWTHT